MASAACPERRAESSAERPPVVTGPIVREPVKPVVTEEKASRLPAAKTYKPGDPVEVRPDLRESPRAQPPAGDQQEKKDAR